ncbi:MAG: DNA-binding protein [Candidatus Thermoplasmatota archaeon]
MNYKQIGQKVLIRLDSGEEIIESLRQICKELNIRCGTIYGIGATNKVHMGLLNLKTKKYQTQEFTGDYEIIPLMGNISTMNGEIYLHIHINICNAKHESFGGHLTSAIVSATCELTIEIIDAQVIRKYDDNIGINQLTFQ